MEEAHSKIDEVSLIDDGILPVLNQKDCQACYAFAGTEACSSLYAREYGQFIQLSPQHIVDSLPIRFSYLNRKTPDKQGCFRSTLSETFQFIQEDGVSFAEDHEYEGCRRKKPKCVKDKKKFRIGGFHPLDKNAEEDILSQLKHQPLGGAVRICKSFGKLEGEEIHMGPKPGETCDGKQAVIIVSCGKKDGVNYYLCKNSWGPEWGKDGYFRIHRDLVSDIMYPVGGYIVEPASKNINMKSSGDKNRRDGPVSTSGKKGNGKLGG